MHSENGSPVPTRSLDELADIAVHRGEHLRRRRHQIRGVSAALAIVLLFVGALRVAGDGSVGVVDTRPADRSGEDGAPAPSPTVDPESTGSEVDAGAPSAVDGPAESVMRNVPSAIDGAGRTATAPPRLLYVVGQAIGGNALWELDYERGTHSRMDGGADLCRPSVSPANGAIAYCKGGALAISDPEGARAPRVLRSNATDPDFSPDGTRIAYVDQSRNDETWTMRTDGSDRRQVTDSVSSDRYPTWSPDGTQLAFVRGNEVSRSVWIVGADGRGAREISGTEVRGIEAYPLDWSPDGRRLAYTCAPATTSVCLLDVASGDSRAITYLQATSPSWSPDGTTIAFTVHPSSTAATSEVWLMRADGAQQRALWQRSASEAPAWYPVFFPVPLR